MASKQEEVKAARHWWGKEGQGRNVYEAALDRVRYTYEHFDEVFVSFSGGKDSTATLHVVLDVAHELGRLPVRVVFFDEECISWETVEYVRRVGERDDVNLEWYCLPVRHRNACSKDHPLWWPWAPEAEELWVRPLPDEAITTLDHFPNEPPELRLSIPDATPLLCPRDRKTAGFLGIRAMESMTRRGAVSNMRPDNWIIPNTAWYSKSYPVYDWTTEDIWTAPAKLGWDYNTTYDRMEMAGITHFSQRCAPPFGEEPMQVLWHWAQCFPELWDKMCERVPGAATAARYSRTELYSHHGVAAPGPELVAELGEIGAWQEHIRRRIQSHDETVRAYIAAKVQDKITRHFTKTTEPIMPTARHPMTSFSWEYLYMIADRGDFKDRRAATEVIAPGRMMERARAAYDIERQRVEQGEVGRA